ncbi:MAG: fibronectin type III domain-containing protein [Bacteroidales bacterium]|nr:fibronectin type III domain-containing protein [Bacteroidales bacterium]
MKIKHLLIFLLLAALCPWTAMAQKTHIANTASDTQMTWAEFANTINSGTTYVGMTVYLDEDITATTMAGTNETKCFKGTFDGQGHTLTFNYTASGSWYTAPFRYLNGATIQNLKVNGTITANYARCGGLAGHCYGNNTIINCLSDITINSSISGDGTHGGFVSVVRTGTTTFYSCAFTGKLLGSSTYKCGGFTGCTVSTVVFNDCVFDPTEITMGRNNSATLSRLFDDNAMALYNNCYYTNDFNDGTHYLQQGGQPYTITGQGPVTVTLYGTATNHNVSHITNSYDTFGMYYNGTLIAQSSIYVVLNLGGVGEFHTDHGTLSGSANPYYLFMDAYNTTISITPCIYPDNLQCTAFDANTATLAWEELGTECGTPFTWQICLNGDEDNLITADSNPFTLTGLIPDLQYSAKVRANYGNQQTVWSNEIGLMLPVTLPYATDFETGSDWMLLNGDCANQWCRGTATSHGGTHGLYISNNGGATNAYNNTVSLVFAAKTFNFMATVYTFSYDWLAYGESNWDFLRVALVPATVSLAAGTSLPSNFNYNNLPESWIALDGGSQLNLANGWQTMSQEIEIATAGSYMMVFAWRNDSSMGTNPPAAIDNVSIAPASCLKPSDVQCTDFTATTATISWTDNSDASAWQISLNDDEAYLIDATTNPFTLSGLEGNASYSVKVRANCGGDGYSVWTDPFTVSTDQYTVGTEPYSSYHTYVPIYVYSNYSLSQQIYTPEELGDAGTIESIAFYMFSGPQRLWRRPLRIYMKYTDIDNYGDSDYVGNAAFIPVTDADMVRIGNGSAGDTETFYLDQWGTVHFDQPFEYDGQHNVAITVWDHFGDLFHVPFATTDASFLYYYTPCRQAIASYKVNSVNPMNLGETNPYGFLANEMKNYIKIGKTYPVPSNLQWADGISGTSASISWTENGTATAWQLRINGEEFNPIEASTNPFILTGLTPGTSYTVQVRSRCDGDFFSGWSDAITFTTLPGSYSTDFETTCDWTLVNGGLTNAWVWGTAAHNGEGTHGLYISNDGGTTNAYTNTSNTMVYATRAYVFNDDIYRVSYDWMANGETSWDYLRVALVPDAIALEAGTVNPLGWNAYNLPSGWIALDGGGKLNQSTEWQTVSNDVWVPAGVYKMVFAWFNDYSAGNNPPAAIDNVSIVPVACPIPANFAAPNVAYNAAQLNWNGPVAIDSYTVRCRATHRAVLVEGFECGLGRWTLRNCTDNTGICITSPHLGQNSFRFYYSTTPPQYLISPMLSDVTEGTRLEFYYRNGYPDILETFQVGFSSTDNATDSFTFGDEITVSDGQWHFYSEFIPAGTKYICWKHTSNDHYHLYIDDIEVGTDIPAGEWLTTTVPGGSTQVSVTFDLSPVTTYEAQVKSDCDDAEWSEITFTTPPIAPIDLQCTAVTGTKASLSWNCEAEMYNYTVRYRKIGVIALSEGFEDGLGNWTLRNCYESTGIYNNIHTHTGQNAFRFYSSDTPTPPQYLISPELSGITESTIMEFYYCNDDYYFPETFQIGFSSTNNAIGSFTFGEEITAADEQWHLYSAPVPAGTKYICWKYTSEWNEALYIDDIYVSAVHPGGEWQSAAATTTSVILTGLAYGTHYEAQVKGDYDSWSEATTFTTLVFPIPFNLQCTSVTATTADLSWIEELIQDSYTVRYRTAAGISQPVFTEGFENGIGDWTLRDCHNNTGINSESYYSGQNAFRFYYNTTPPQYLISPELSGVAEGMKLEFYYRNKTAIYPETFHVGFSGTDNATDSFTFGGEITASDEQWHLYSETIPAGTKYICWKLTSNDRLCMYVNDIVVGAECPAGEWQTATTTTTGITLTSLTPNTVYEAQVKGVCDESDWSEVINFTTLESLVFTKEIEGYGTGEGGWHLIASPVMDAVTPADNNGFLTNAYDLYRFNSTHEDNEWENYKDTPYDLVNGQGYLYANSEDVTLAFSGAPITGNEPVEVPLTYDATDDHKCWNLVGNPFDGAARLNRQYYVMKANGTGINPIPIEGSTPIPPFTAVFVKAVANGDKAVFSRVTP